MKTKIIEDRRGRKYELHPAVLTERSTRWDPERYAILRADLKIALSQNPTGVLPVLRQNTPEHFKVIVYNNGRVRIGCRLFFSQAGKTLRKWALS